MSARVTRAVVAAALASASAASCGSEEPLPLPPEESVQSLAVFVLDALPATAVGAYGYERDTTPSLDRLAERGVRFAEAYAPASYTLASVSSMMTGLSPAAHGVVGLDSNVLHDERRTLAEALSEAGFATGGFSSNPHVTEEGGFAQGFDVFRHYERGRFDEHRIPRRLERDAWLFWEEHAGERRFLYVHVLPPHQPYDAPEPHASLFGADETEREMGLTDWLVEADRQGLVEPGSPEARAIRARYDAGLHHADAFLGRFLDRMTEAGAGRDTAICVVSDHGEAFGEHGRLLHGSTVFEEMTRVPLVLSWPGAEPTVVDELVSTADLAPTLCHLLRVPFREGRSFLAAVWREVETPPVLSRSVGNRPVWSLRTEEWTLVQQRSSGTRLLFDRRRDRGEVRDLLRAGEAPGEARRIADELAGELARELARARRGRRLERRSDGTHRAAIEDLGYADLESADPSGR